MICGRKTNPRSTTPLCSSGATAVTAQRLCGDIHVVMTCMASGDNIICAQTRRQQTTTSKTSDDTPCAHPRLSPNIPDALNARPTHLSALPSRFRAPNMRPNMSPHVMTRFGDIWRGDDGGWEEVVATCSSSCQTGHVPCSISTLPHTEIQAKLLHNPCMLLIRC